MENTIYFAVGFKSYDVTRNIGTAGEWFEWTERSRNAITRTTFNKRTMEWVVRTLREASKTERQHSSKMEEGRGTIGDLLRTELQQIRTLHFSYQRKRKKKSGTDHS